MEKTKTLTQISIMGNRDKWLEFSAYVKRVHRQKAWHVLEPMINQYLENEKKKQGEQK